MQIRGAYGDLQFFCQFNSLKYSICHHHTTTWKIPLNSPMNEFALKLLPFIPNGLNDKLTHPQPKPDFLLPKGVWQLAWDLVDLQPISPRLKDPRFWSSHRHRTCPWEYSTEQVHVPAWRSWSIDPWIPPFEWANTRELDIWWFRRKLATDWFPRSKRSSRNWNILEKIFFSMTVGFLSMFIFNPSILLEPFWNVDDVLIVETALKQQLTGRSLKRLLKTTQGSLWPDLNF